MSEHDDRPARDSGRTRPRIRPEGPQAQDAPASADGVTELAHELANLLDGSMRWLSLAAQSLRGLPAGQPVATEEDPTATALRQLDAANAGLRRMAAVVDAALRSKAHAIGSPDLMLGGKTVGSGQSAAVTLAEAVDHAIDVVTPLARMNAVEIRARIDRAAGQAPAGPLYSVVLNALRNAVESAAAASGHRLGGAVEIGVRSEGETGRIVIEVTDDGVGPPPDIDAAAFFSHGFSTKPSRDGLAVRGLGLAIARELVAGVGGEIALLPRGLREPGRPGAVLRVACAPPTADTRFFGHSPGSEDDGG